MMELKLEAAQRKRHSPGMQDQVLLVLGRYFVQFQETYYASVMVDELLFFNRNLNPQEVQILYNVHK